jgi:1-aminocyclopropane-1-carboxylate deaminase/D-cysteine desulfhydrase-like pyridoxal-dependent ACC family enzyme
MFKEIDNNVSNISILMNKYGFRCKGAMENPEAMMKEWGNKVLDKHYKTNE